MAIGEINTLRLNSQAPVSTTRYRTVHFSSSKYKSSTSPIAPSLAIMAAPFKFCAFINIAVLQN
jgi:hypothetical protein